MVIFWTLMFLVGLRGRRAMTEPGSTPVAHKAKPMEEYLVKLDSMPDGQGFYRKFIHQSKPVLFRKGARHWPATRLWRSSSYLKESFSEEIIPVVYKAGSEHFSGPVNFGRVLDQFGAEDFYCSANVTLNSHLLSDIYIPSILQCDELKNDIETVELVLSGNNKSFAFKQESRDMVLATINGKRRILLYGREFTETFFRNKKVDSRDLFDLDPEETSSKTYLKTDGIPHIEVILEPGDILYIPQFWWHHIKSLDHKQNIDIILWFQMYDFSETIESMGVTWHNDIVKFSELFHKLREEQRKEISCSDNVHSLRSFLKISSNENETLHLRIPKKRERPGYVKLASGYEMPPIGFGTALLNDSATMAVKTALEVGFRFIDTAQGYPGAEKSIAVALRESGVPREEVFITTKLHPRYLGYNTTLAAIKMSMQDLEVAYIDLFLIHSKDCDDFLLQCSEGEPNGTWQESWKAMEEAQRLGWIRSLGVSNFEVADLKQLVRLAKVPVSIVQNWFDPLYQDKRVRKFCAKHKIKYQGYSPLGFQWLTMGMSYNPVLTSELIISIAANHDYVASHVVLRYAIHKDVTPITRSTDPNHIAQNFRSLDISLHPMEIEAIDQYDDAMAKALQEIEEQESKRNSTVEKSEEKLKDAPRDPPGKPGKSGSREEWYAEESIKDKVPKENDLENPSADNIGETNRIDAEFSDRGNPARTEL